MRQHSVNNSTSKQLLSSNHFAAAGHAAGRVKHPGSVALVIRAALEHPPAPLAGAWCVQDPLHRPKHGQHGAGEQPGCKPARLPTSHNTILHPKWAPRPRQVRWGGCCKRACRPVVAAAAAADTAAALATVSGGGGVLVCWFHRGRLQGAPIGRLPLVRAACALTAGWCSWVTQLRWHACGGLGCKHVLTYQPKREH